MSRSVTPSSQLHTNIQTNHGLRAAWFDSWWPESDTEHAIIVEDDLELAPMWLSWLRKAWLSYRHRSDLAGVALSRQFLMFKKPERLDISINNIFIQKIITDTLS